MSYAPEPGPDGRPRPRYGEYATPEEQRARIQQPAVTDAISSGVAPTAPPAPVAPAPVAATAKRGSTADRVITFALLGYGLFTVITSIPGMVDYPRFADTFFAMVGVDATLTDPAAGRVWGVAGALVLGIGWVLTLVLSWRNLKAGRLTFWLPLTAGIVCTVIASVLLMAPLMMDPAVWAALQGAVVPPTP